MPDSSLIPVGRRRTSFLDDDYSGDRRLREWAEETGRLGETETEGSDFYQTEQADPSKKFLGAFVARKRSQGLPTDLTDSSGKQVDLPYDAKPILSTQDKTRKDRLTNARAMSFKGDFDQDMQKRDMEAERARRKAEQLDAETRAREGRVSEAREMRKLDQEFQSPEQKMQADLLKLKMDEMGKDIGERDVERTRMSERRSRDVGRESILRQGQDIPGISQSGERAASDALASGMDLPQAEALARRAHEDDIAEIQRLESTGQPDKIAAAAKLRQDPDLRGVRSFIPERNRLREEQTVLGEVDPYLESLDEAADSASWFSDRADYASIDEQDRSKLNMQMSDAVRNIRAAAPQLSMEEIQSMVLKRARERGMPSDFLVAIRSLVQ
jgi:hypothetical protein